MDVKTLDKMLRDKANKAHAAEVRKAIRALQNLCYVGVHHIEVPPLVLQKTGNVATGQQVLSALEERIIAADVDAVGQQAVEEFVARHEAMAAEVAEIKATVEG
jgi:predicted proteasome-type protease